MKNLLFLLSLMLLATTAGARAPAQMEAGEQAMTVTVTGTIQLEAAP